MKELGTNQDLGPRLLKEICAHLLSLYSLSILACIYQELKVSLALDCQSERLEWKSSNYLYL